MSSLGQTSAASSRSSASRLARRSDAVRSPPWAATSGTHRPGPCDSVQSARLIVPRSRRAVAIVTCEPSPALPSPPARPAAAIKAEQCAPASPIPVLRSAYRARQYTQRAVGQSTSDHARRRRAGVAVAVASMGVAPKVRGRIARSGQRPVGRSTDAAIGQGAAVSRCRVGRSTRRPARQSGSVPRSAPRSRRHRPCARFRARHARRRCCAGVARPTPTAPNETRAT